ncbi:MAG: hypothetical protein WB770_02170 [Acidimicrobiales bacterium]
MSKARGLVPRRGCGALVATAVLASALGLAGCTSARNALGPSESPCFRAIPLARAAVNDKGRFSGVRYMSAVEFARAIKQAKAFAGSAIKLPDALVDVRGPVCAIAYRGSYDAKRVASGWAPLGEHGTLALVVVRLQKLDVVATVVLSRPPLRLSRLLPPFI